MEVRVHHPSFLSPPVVESGCPLLLPFAVCLWLFWLGGSGWLKPLEGTTPSPATNKPMAAFSEKRSIWFIFLNIPPCTTKVSAASAPGLQVQFSELTYISCRLAAGRQAKSLLPEQVSNRPTWA